MVKVALLVAAAAGYFQNLMCVAAMCDGLRHKPSFKARVVGARPDRDGIMQKEVYSLSDREFKRCYRMDKPTFRFVLSRVRPHFHGGISRRGDDIGPDLALALVLTWLRGGAYQDSCRIHKCSV